MRLPKSKTLEITLLYLVTLIWTVGLTLIQSVWAPMANYTLALVALAFVYLPLEVLAKRGENQEDFGIHLQNPLRSLKWAALAVILVFPVYTIGFDVWQTQVSHRTRDLESARFARWPFELDGLVVTDQGVSLAQDGRDLVIQWHDLDGDLTFTADRGLSQKNGQGQVSDNVFSTLGRKSGFARLIHTGDSLELRAPAKEVALGLHLQPESLPYKAERSPWWFLTALLTQLLLIAMPEELFYRGYLQTRLDSLVGRVRRIRGVDINIASIVLTSTLFALGHIATIPNPARLAVFFPSLLFGVLRRVSGGILAPLVFHACCNLLSELLTLAYL